MKPADQQEFEGSSTPPGFTGRAWSGTNFPTFAAGKLKLDGGRLYSTVKYPTGTSIEFSAKFSDDAFENIGFSADGDFNGPWAVIGRDQVSSKGYLYARSSNGGREVLGTALTGQYHRFKIKLNSTTVEFFVDGLLQATITQTTPGGVIQISDFNANALELSVDWVRILPYTLNGNYVSGVYDAGSSTSWRNIFWNYIQPQNTTVALSVRTGNTPVPDGTWSDFLNIPNGGTIDIISRYIQYNVSMVSSDKDATAVLQKILVTCNYAFATPVDNLTGTVTDNDVRLAWSTEVEYNNKGFEIQRSLNGTDWITIGFIDGAGNSSTHVDYQYLDKGLPTGVYYYRLKQVDIDNKFRYSNMVSVTIASPKGFSLEQNYPNPFTNQTTIAYSIPRATKVRLSIYDVQGRLMQTIDEGMKTPGRYVVDVHTDNLGKGIYYYRMDAENFSTARKMFLR